MNISDLHKRVNGAETTKLKIVTDGLIQYLDSTNPLSYPSTGNTWFDLELNNDGEIFNNPSFDGQFFQFNNANNYVRTILDIGDSVTMLFWINGNYMNHSLSFYSRRNINNNDFTGGVTRLNFIQNNGWIFVGYRGGGSTSNNYFIYNDNIVLQNLGRLNEFNNNKVDTIFCLWPNTGAFNTNNTQFLTFTINDPTTDIQTTIGGFRYFQPPVRATFIGITPTISSTLRLQAGFKMGKAMIYNRQLSNEEIINNFNVDKSKFGL